MGLYDFRTSGSISSILVRLRRLDRTSPRLVADEYQQTASNFSPVVQSVMNSDLQIQLSSPVVDKKGSVPPTYNNTGFGIVATDTQATIYWDGVNGGSTIIVIHRANGTQQAVPAGSIVITGLTASTTYYSLPYWSPYSACTIGWVQGTAGTPQILFTSITDLQDAWQQNQQNREPLSNTYLTFTTGAPASPPVTLPPLTPGGHPLRCVKMGTNIETLDGSPYDQALEENDDWWVLLCTTGEMLICTPDHPLYTPDGHRQDAQLFSPGDRICHKNGDLVLEKSQPMRIHCTKVAVTMSKLHLFWANGFLSHNIKMDPQIL